MKLSEIKSGKYLKLLLIGDAGVGKTVFAASLPTPIKYLDFDGKISSAARFHAKDQARLEAIEVHQLAANLVIDPIKELMLILKELEALIKTKELENKYSTLVIDSLTTFSALCLQHIINTNPGIKRNISAQGQQPTQQDYGILKREFSRIIPGLLSLPMHVIMLGHIKTEKDETTGEILRECMLDGSYAQELPIHFDEVWRAYVENKGNERTFRAQTQNDGKFKCRSQLQGLPANIKLDFNEIEPYLK